MRETMFEKIWSRHVVTEGPGGQTLLYIDRHLLHEGSSAAFVRLEQSGRRVRRPDRCVATADHYLPTTPPGTPIPLDRIKGMDEQQLATTFGAAALDRKDEPARVLRYQSDACTLFVSLYRRNGAPWRAEFADAYDTHMRPLPAAQCAGSVAAQKKRVA